MKRISGGQLSRKAKATLLSSHAGDPRAATGDRRFASQSTETTQQSRVSPPPARGLTSRVGRHRPDPETMTVTAVSRTEGSEPPNDQLEAQAGTDRATWLLVWTRSSYSSGRSSHCWLTMTMQHRRTALLLFEEYDQSRAGRHRLGCRTVGPPECGGGRRPRVSERRRFRIQIGEHH